MSRVLCVSLPMMSSRQKGRQDEQAHPIFISTPAVTPSPSNSQWLLRRQVPHSPTPCTDCNDTTLRSRNSFQLLLTQTSCRPRPQARKEKLANQSASALTRWPDGTAAAAASNKSVRPSASRRFSPSPRKKEKRTPPTATTPDRYDEDRLLFREH